MSLGKSSVEPALTGMASKSEVAPVKAVIRSWTWTPMVPSVAVSLACIVTKACFELERENSIFNSPNTYIENDLTVKNGKLIQDISDLWVSIGGLPRDEGICQGKSGGGESRDDTE